MSDIKTNKDMNKSCVEWLKFRKDSVSMYAAQRIEELERENNELRQELDKLKKFVSKDYEAVKKILGVNQ
jgi:transposase-like protein